MAFGARWMAMPLVVAVACGYTSSYVPPDNYRARPMYRGDRVVFTGPPGLPRCASEVTHAASAGPPPPPMTIDARGNWGPAVQVHLAFVGPVPPHWYVFPPTPGHMAAHAVTGGSSSLFGGGGGGGGGNGKGAAYLVAALLAAAAVASSAVAVGLAADPPEGQVAEGIDGVNRYNDEARRKIAECMKSDPRVLAPPPEAQ